MAAAWGWPSYWIWPGLAGLVFFLAETSKTNQAPLLASKTWVYLGEISFAAYMVHLPVDIALYQIVERVIGEPKGTMALVIGIGSVWTSIVVAAIAGSAFYGLVAMIEKRVTFWHPSQRR